MDSNQRVIDFSLNKIWSDLPETVQHQCKRALLDNLGVLIAGGITPASQITREFVEEQMGCSSANAVCTVVSTGKKASAVGAALANGIAANGLDMDDGYKAAKGHPGAALLPVVLAATELAGDADGRDFLTALVVGYELAIRAAIIRHAADTTYHSTGSWGAIGGFGFRTPQTRHGNRRIFCTHRSHDERYRCGGHDQRQYRLGSHGGYEFNSSGPQGIYRYQSDF